MKHKVTVLDSVRVLNFKAIHNSGVVKFRPLTVLIGNNGSGKSSLIEALETVQTMVPSGLDRALQLWRGIEHIRYKGKQPKFRPGPSGELRTQIPLEFHLRGRLEGDRFSATTTINERGGANEVFFERESFKMGNERHEREEDEFERFVNDKKQRSARTFPPSHSLLSPHLGDYVRRWQFLRLLPENIGQPTPQTRSGDNIRLKTDASNLAEYLLEIRSLDPEAFQDICETLQYVLPYANDIQPTITTELERSVYLQLTEADFKVPGWLLSTGTLRILALLACLRHPNPPSLLVVEEIENGLDPRTLKLVVEEIRAAIEAKTTQVILTTHSPYLLDLLDLSHIIVVERDEGQPVFRRPDSEGLAQWAKSFSPGRLYTMGRLTRRQS